MRFLKIILALVAVWLLTAVSIVGSNERAVVRRCGRAVRQDDGSLVLYGNGLHFDWPWPISQVDRVNLNEVRTLEIPAGDSRANDESLLLGDGAPRELVFLTGDKNLLNVRLAVQYRIAEAGVEEFFFGSDSIENRLAASTEAVAAERFAESGVDFVQVSGISELRRMLADRLQRRADAQRLGLVIDDVSLEEISPPVQVKADFLDVANARAEREQLIQMALSSADQRRRSAEADAREIRDAAESEARETLQAANGSAARFLQIIQEFHDPHSPDANARSAARRLALERYYYQTVAEVLERVKGKVFLDTGEPVDLTIWGPLNLENAATPKSPPVPDSQK